MPLTLVLVCFQQDWNGYTDKTMDDVKAAIDPLEVAGPSGTVVLWHSLLAHVGGQNTLPDVIRQAAIYDVHKVRTAHLSACLWWLRQIYCVRADTGVVA